MRIVGIGVVFLLMLCGGAIAQTVKNYTTEGNLAPTQNPGCIAYQGADNSLSPADLHLAVLACAEQKNFAGAADLFILMQLRAVFDAKRVADPSAGQAGTVLKLTVRQALGSEKTAALQAAFEDFGGNGSSRHQAFCAAMQRNGPPQYYPAYMIQHGMWAFTQPEADPLVAGFDAAAVWKELLGSYMKCA